DGIRDRNVTGVQTCALPIWCRWRIEVFFKQIKQTLQLADFLGTSANAVRWQVWTALLVYLLLRYLAFLSNWAHSFSRLFALVRRSEERRVGKECSSRCASDA